MSRPNEADLQALLTKIARRDASGLAPDDDIVRELGIDSLSSLRVLAAIEKKYAVRFPDERLGEFRTIRTLAEFLAEREDEA
jgi:acyl carrier protein